VPDSMGQVSVVFGEVVKIATGALAVWAWKTAKTLSGLAPRMAKVEEKQAVVANYAEAPAVEKRLAEEGAKVAAEMAALAARIERQRIEDAERDRKLARLEGKLDGMGTPVGGNAVVQDRPSFRDTP
jgi:hypothetical protein